MTKVNCLNPISELGTGLFNNNYGIVENIQINLKECTDTERQSVTLMGWGNFGTINNFIVNSEKSLLGNRDLSLVVRNNYGTIKNGYIYGENIKALHSIGNQSRNIGGIACLLYTSDAADEL